jgi:hypothetical protein
MTVRPRLYAGRRSALHYAAIYGRLELAQLLLRAGAAPNLRDKAGWQVRGGVVRKHFWDFVYKNPVS